MTLTIVFITLFSISLWSQQSASSATHHLDLGDSAYNKFDNETALENYRQAYDSDTSSYEAAWKLSRAYVDVGESSEDKDKRKSYFQKGAEFARRAVELNPEGAKGHLFMSVALGRVALDAGPKERVRLSKQVKAEVDRALELDPNDDVAWHVLGRWHRKLATLSWIEKKFADIFLGGVPKEASVEKAVDCFKKAVEIKPESIQHHFELGVTYEKLDKKALAIEQFEKVLELPVTDAADPEHQQKAKEWLEKLK